MSLQNNSAASDASLHMMLKTDLQGQKQPLAACLDGAEVR